MFLIGKFYAITAMTLSRMMKDFEEVGLFKVSMQIY